MMFARRVRVDYEPFWRPGDFHQSDVPTSEIDLSEYCGLEEYFSLRGCVCMPTHPTIVLWVHLLFPEALNTSSQ